MGGGAAGSIRTSSAMARGARCNHKLPATTPMQIAASKPSEAQSHLRFGRFGPDMAARSCDVVPKGLGADESSASSSRSRPTGTSWVSASGEGELGGALDPRMSAR